MNLFGLVDAPHPHPLSRRERGRAPLTPALSRRERELEEATLRVATTL